MKQVVYRVENNLGIGPYAAYVDHPIELAELFEPHGDNSVYPGWLFEIQNQTKSGLMREVLYNILERDYVSGFSSLEQLRDWFPEDDMKILSKYGFKINSYTVEQNDIYHFQSKKQIAFKKP